MFISEEMVSFFVCVWSEQQRRHLVAFKMSFSMKSWRCNWTFAAAPSAIKNAMKVEREPLQMNVDQYDKLTFNCPYLGTKMLQ